MFTTQNDCHKGAKEPVLMILGTRPELIKLAPVFKAFNSSQYFEPLIFFTGQHSSLIDELWSTFDLKPHFSCQTQSCESITGLVGLVLNTLDQLFSHQPAESLTPKETDTHLANPPLTVCTHFQTPISHRHRSPSLVVVQGDTTSAVIGALWSFYHKIPLAHVEAGLRTYQLDSPWPEEFNRRIISLAAKWHFCPSDLAKKNLESERLSLLDPGQRARIKVVGNTSIDALKLTLEKLDRNPSLKLDLERRLYPIHFNKPYLLVTLLRRETFGDKLKDIFRALISLSEKYQVVIPLHPNPSVQRAADECQLRSTKVLVIPPQDYLSFVFLMAHAQLLITDSGGIQEEVTYLKKIALIVREVTERKEALETGYCHLIGTQPDKIIAETESALMGEKKLVKKSFYPYGQGDASEKILRALEFSMKNEFSCARESI